MERLRRRPAIDITWISCRGVRSSLPFHTPCLYASVFVASSSLSPKDVHGHRRPHRVKTPTDRAGGENPEWDEPLRLYLSCPDAAASRPASTAPEQREVARKKKGRPSSGGSGDDVLLLRFELKAEVAVLGDVLAASAAVPVPDLVADGQTRRVSYQLAGPDGRQPNGVVSFSYAFHERTHDHDRDCRVSDGEAATPPRNTVSTSCPVAGLPPTGTTTTTEAPRLYPTIEWPPMEQISIYPPLPATTARAEATVVYPPPPPAPPVEPLAVYPPYSEPSRSPPCVVYRDRELAPPASASGIMYPTVDLAPMMSCYPPAPPLYAVGHGYSPAPAPEWNGRCLYG